jgi:hypothetical protein
MNWRLFEKGMTLVHHIRAFIAFCALTLQGCLPGLDGVSQFRGGKNECLSRGCVTTLTLVKPDDEVVVVVVFPEPRDMDWFEGVRSGNGTDRKVWKEEYEVRLLRDANAEPLRVAWDYSPAARVLAIAGVRTEVPKGKIAVVRFDVSLKPSCEVQDNAPAVVERLRNELGAENVESEPVQPAQYSPGSAR